MGCLEEGLPAKSGRAHVKMDHDFSTFLPDEVKRRLALHRCPLAVGAQLSIVKGQEEYSFGERGILLRWRRRHGSGLCLGMCLERPPYSGVVRIVSNTRCDRERG